MISTSEPCGARVVWRVIHYISIYRRLVVRVRDEACAAVRVASSDARACCGIELPGVLCVPCGGVLALIAPQGACKHAVVLLDLPVLRRVANERAGVVDRDAVPFVDLRLRWVRVVSEGLGRIEDLVRVRVRAIGLGLGLGLGLGYVRDMVRVRLELGLG